jgi:EthD domain
MQKGIYFLQRRPGMAREEFITYYETVHQPLIMANLPRPLDFRRHFPVWSPSAQTRSADGRFDSLTAITYESRQAFMDAFKRYSSSSFNPIVVEDEARFIDRGRVFFVPVEEVIAADSEDDFWCAAPPSPGGKLLRFVWRPDEIDAAEFRARDRSTTSARALLEGCLEVRRNYLMPDDPLAFSTQDLAGIDRLTDYRRCDAVEEYSFAADGDARAALARLARADFGRRNGPAALQVETVACDLFVSVYEEG